ncbi:MAG: hypothetical protein GY822_32525 [Deltaproteobacteria bacterium]|nr:hypothetical protein [Deltaproteobacteria bacterium]
MFLTEWYYSSSDDDMDIEVTFTPFFCTPGEGSCDAMAGEEIVCNAEGTAYENTACGLGCNVGDTACASFCSTQAATIVSGGTTSIMVPYANFNNDYSQTCGPSSTDNYDTILVLTASVDGTLQVLETSDEAAVVDALTCDSEAAIDCHDFGDQATVDAVAGETYVFVLEWYSDDEFFDMPIDIVFTAN